MDFEQDAAAPPATGGELSKIGDLVDKYEEAVTERKRLEDQLKRVKETERYYAEEAIPSAMDEVGMAELTLADGTAVSVQEFTRASIPKKYKDDAHRWLEENGFGDLIKTRLQASAGRGELERMRQLAEYISEQSDLVPSIEEAVHPQTLGAFVREQRANGTELPHDLLGIYEGRTTKLVHNN